MKSFGLPKLDFTNAKREIDLEPEKPRVVYKPVSGYSGPGVSTDTNAPVNHDQHIVSHSRRLSVGFSATMGRRENMEDRLVIAGGWRGKKDEDYCAVFDGHSGESAAIFASKHLHNIIARNMDFIDDTDPSSVMNCLHDSFFECQDQMKAAKVDSGTTALVSIFIKNDLYIANAGDCRAVISLCGREKRLTVDHKPTLPSEKLRIQSIKGGFVDNKGRVQGRLSVARSLGDLIMSPHVSCEPEVFGPFHFGAKARNPPPDFLILACDGLWDTVPDRKAVKIVKKYLSPEKAASALRDKAAAAGSRDNISIIVVFFPGYTGGSYQVSASTRSESSSSIEDASTSSDGSSSSSGSGSSTGSDSSGSGSSSSGSGSDSSGS